MIRNAGGALIVAVVAVLACFRVAADTPLAIHIHTERAMFQVLVSPGTVGTDSFVLQLMSGDGALLPVKEATLILTLPARASNRRRGGQRWAPTAIGTSRTWQSRLPAAGTCASRHRPRSRRSR
jgi:hypothetical protein